MKLFLKLVIQILLLPVTIWLFLYRKIRGRKKLSYISISIVGTLAETPPDSNLLHFFRPQEPRYYDLLLGLYSLERALKKKKFQKEIRSILVHIDSPQIGWARAWELREQLRKIAASGVDLWAFLHSGDRLSYYIATGCPAIATAPANSLELCGFSSEQLFFKGALDRFGIRPNFITIGDYKSTAEAYTRKNASPLAKKQLKEIINTIHNELNKAISERPGNPDLKALQRKALFTPDEAYESGLINAIMYPEQLEFLLSLGIPTKYVPLKNALNVIRWRSTKLLDWRKTKRIALVVGEGLIIDSEESVPNAISLFDYEPAIQKLKEDGCDAIIYRWNSPGGSAYASDILWQRIMSAAFDCPFPYMPDNDPFIRVPRQAQLVDEPDTTQKSDNAGQDKESPKVREVPVYVSMSDVAASGGYYLSAVSKRVFASPLTITGSIGVVSGKFNIAGLLDKFGISTDGVSVGENGNLFSTLGDFSETQKKIIRHNIENIYRIFRSRIALARDLTDDEILASAGGRIFSGKEAIQRKLVDATASLADILDQVRADLKLKENDQVNIMLLPHIKSPLLSKSLWALPFFASYGVWRALAKEKVFTLETRLF